MCLNSGRGRTCTIKLVVRSNVLMGISFDLIVYHDDSFSKIIVIPVCSQPSSSMVFLVASGLLR